MPIVRRFLVLQALMLWQGGSLFYAAVVVPTGTEVLGSFQQGSVTRHVTDAMNLIGVVCLLILAWDQLQSLPTFRRTRWTLWSCQAVMLAGLFWLHGKVERLVDFSANGHIADYPVFYLWHRVYLYATTAQWLIGLVNVMVMLRVWNAVRTAPT
jgi:hypothetical protein